ncbi:ATP-dependent DNA helicase PIF1-like protein [Tanacetum coccineum]
MEIQELLHKYGRSLADFKDLPQLDPSLLTNMDNRLIRKALDFDIKKARLNMNNCIHRDTGKTFLCKTIISRLRSERKIVLAVASSGIASLLLSAGRTAHSRFVIPLDVLAVGNGTLPSKVKEGEDEPTCIDIPEKFLIKTWDCPIRKIVEETYPDFTSRRTNDEYLKERAILTPRNEDTDAINEYMFKKLPGEVVTYNSAAEICKASTDNINQHQLYPIEFLNSLNFPGSHIGNEVVIHRIILTSAQSK